MTASENFRREWVGLFAEALECSPEDLGKDETYAQSPHTMLVCGVFMSVLEGLDEWKLVQQDPKHAPNRAVIENYTAVLEALRRGCSEIDEKFTALSELFHNFSRPSIKVGSKALYMDAVRESVMSAHSEWIRRNNASYDNTRQNKRFIL